MNTGHNLVNRVTDNCKIIVKLSRCSPKRGSTLEVVKERIRDCKGNVPLYYTSLSKKVLNFYVTRWTVRASYLMSIDINHLSILSMFAEIMMDKEEKKDLNEEMKREVIGLICYMQKFESIFGIKLSIRFYLGIDTIANNLQGAKVSMSNAIKFVKKLIDKLEVKREDFEYFWKRVEANRMKYNKRAEANEILQRHNMFISIESASCPRISLKHLRQVVDTDKETIKAHWKEHYVGAFDTILKDLNDKLNSPLIQAFVKIENFLLNSIIAPDTPLVVTLMNSSYGDESGLLNAQLRGITTSDLTIELIYLRRQRRNSKGE